MAAATVFQGAIAGRSVARIVDPAASAIGSRGHRARRLIGADDPAFADPFLLMAEDWMPRGAFAIHPHRGIETVTFVVEGTVEHYDDAGHRGVVQSGDAQWMTAGRGLHHAEDALPGTTAHVLQLWVNLPAAFKMTEPRYQDLLADRVPTVFQPGMEVKVFSGRVGDADSGTLNHVPVLMLEIRVSPGATARLSLPGGDNAFLFVLRGSARAGPEGDRIAQGQLAWLTRPEGDAPSELGLVADEEACRLLLFSGPPLREPVVFGGPFVMNTREEIEQAFRDYAIVRR